MPSRFHPPAFSASTPQALFALASRLFPICRSITGEGLRASLEILKEAYEDAHWGGVNLAAGKNSSTHFASGANLTPACENSSAQSALKGGGGVSS